MRVYLLFTLNFTENRYCMIRNNVYFCKTSN